MKLTFKSDVTWEHRPAMHARVGKHDVIMDEVAAAGGTDEGPNPLQYLLSSLGGCFIAMGRLVAQEMGLDIKSIRCQVEGDIDNDGLLAKNPAVRPGFLAIRMKLHADTAEDQARMAEWLKQVEARCPVKNCLSTPVPIEVKTA
jgi:Predicted redox protein, regulator of disulfide bond formation